MAKSKLPDELIFIENRRASQKTTTASMAGKVCVVSGSTSGVGLAAVRRLAARQRPYRHGLPER